MDLFVVLDTLGAGRIVGIFSSREFAAEVVRVEPHYYHLLECKLDDLNPEALTWAQGEGQREALRRLSQRRT